MDDQLKVALRKNFDFLVRALGWTALGIVVLAAIVGVWIKVVDYQSNETGELTVSVDPGTTPADQEVIRQATKAFLAACPLAQYSSDIESITATLWPEPVAPYRADEYGWAREVELKVKIKNETGMIPASYRAWGHTLYYYIGAGSRPGFVAKKDASNLVCGLAYTPGSDRFVPAPDMARLGL